MAFTPTTIDYDPDLPVYAEPEDTEFQPVDIAEHKDVGQYVDPSLATVEGRTTNLMQSGNPLLQVAKADTARTYNSRGLLNSGGAATGGTTAMLRTAAEIATPDALLYGQMAQAEQKTDQDAAINNQVSQLEQNTELLRGRVSGALTTQELGGQVEIQKMSDAAQLQRIEVDNQWKQAINWDNIDAADKQALEQVSATFGESLTGGIERVIRDSNVENKTDAISALMTTYQSQMSTAAAIVGIQLEWS